MRKNKSKGNDITEILDSKDPLRCANVTNVTMSSCALQWPP